VNPSTLMPATFAIVLLAPFAAIVASSRRGMRPWSVVWPVLVAVAALVVISAAAAIAGRSSDRQTIVIAHLTLASGALAAGAIGALCGRLFADVLDAAAAGAAIVLCLTFALLLAGDVVGDLPVVVLDNALVASPLVAVASAANIDLLRDDTWYRLSPISHRFFNYPDWPKAVGAYGLVSLACFAGLAWQKETSL